MASIHLYREDLEGLRGLAVSLVVLFHAGLISGGFVGVDVFFVLSGFFMADIIARELDAGSFRFSRFYARRIRRILPALAALLAVTFVFAWLLFMPEELESFAKSVFSAAAMFANIRFESESGYFDVNAHLKPLLHTWSLSLEEQFYLIFPVGLFLLRRHVRNRLLAILVAVAGASFVLSVWRMAGDPDAAFYLLPYRVWELLIGAIIALRPVSVRAGVATGLTLLGIAGILLAGLLFTKTTPFPGSAAALPCLSAGLIVAVGAQSQLARRLLGFAGLRFVGRTSYSIYLWHWPIVVFLPYFLPSAYRPWSAALIVIGSLVLGYASWRYVEQPFRTPGVVGSTRLAFGGLGLTAAVAAVLALFISENDGLPYRVPLEARALYAAKFDASSFSEPRCFADSDGAGLSPSAVRGGGLCKMGEEGGTPSFLLWGDSHAAAIAPAVDVAARRHGLSGLFVGRGSCPPLPATQFGAAGDVHRCVEFLDAVVALVKERRFNTVLLAGYWPKYVHRRELPGTGIFFDVHAPILLEDWSAPVRRGLTEVVSQIIEAGSRPALILDVPEMGFDVPAALARAEMTGGSLEIAPPLDYTMRRQALSRRVIDDVARHAGAEVVDPLAAICDTHRCHAMLGQTVLYHDEDHLANSGAQAISHVFDATMARIARDLGVTKVD